MKFTRFICLTLAGAGLIGGLSACSDDKKDTPEESIIIKDENGNITLTIKDPEKWIAAAKKVAADLREDAYEKVDDWLNEEAIKLQTQAASESVIEMIDECADEANDIATEKIPTPLALFTTGDDCLANIGSIRNVLLGSLDGTVNQASIIAMTAVANPALAQKISTQLADCATKIQAIPQPLKQNASGPEAKAAIAACRTFEQTLESELIPLFRTLAGEETALKAIVNQYATGVVTPSVNAAKAAADELFLAINTLPAQPTEAHVQAIVAAYIKARGALDLCAAFL